MSEHLFSPVTIGKYTLPNRIAIAPMCQYSADDGTASDWHLFHWMNLALSGAAMVTLEMTDVERRGRISHGCLGMYSDHNEQAAQRALQAARAVAMPGTIFGPQLAHAGRKASCQRPWEGGGPLGAGQDPWPVVSASALPYADGYQTPHALTDVEIVDMIGKFAEAARRTQRAGFDFVEIHGAHGYLLHQFLSPLSNRRTDRWGGSLENRMRLIIDVARAIIAAAPGLMIGARLSVKDWVDGGLTEDESVEVAKALKSEGVAYICCSSGGLSPLQRVPSGRAYQAHLATYIKDRVDIPVRAVGMIDIPSLGEEIIRSGRADMIAVGRPLLADPRWPWRAAAEAGVEIAAANQYLRATDLRQRWAKETSRQP
jgi:2,4-dienoyl-CoA reductase-like NADH-dependent reductase (Old Yellow Enzyme family)